MIKRVLFLTVVILSLMLAACETKAINNGKKENKMKTIELTKSDFLKKIVDYEKNPEEWKYLGDKPALIDFYASWCGPCKAIAPIIAELAEEHDGRLVVGKCDVEENDELALEFGIRNIPTILFFKNGEIVDKFVGATTKSKLQEKFEAIL